MRDGRPLLRAAWAIVERDLLMFASYRFRFVAQAFAILFTTVLFYYVSRLVEVEPFDPDTYFGFVVAGLVGLEILTATVAQMPAAVRNELLAGTFERMAVSPLGPSYAVAAMTVFPAVRALVVGAMTVLVAVVIFGLDLQWETVPAALPVAALIVLAFTPLALLIAAGVLIFKQAGAAAAFAVTGLSLASGAFFPVELLPSWLEWISEIQPLTPALELLRHVLLGTEVEDGVAVAVAKLVGFAAVLMPAALVLLDAAVRRCRRDGTLTEY
jgi:ABC-type multidrug transport system permease subunit